MIYGSPDQCSAEFAVRKARGKPAEGAKGCHRQGKPLPMTKHSRHVGVTLSADAPDRLVEAADDRRARPLVTQTVTFC